MLEKKYAYGQFEIDEEVSKRCVLAIVEDNLTAATHLKVIVTDYSDSWQR